MTRKQDSRKRIDWRRLLKEDQDLLRAMVRAVAQELPKAETRGTLGVQKAERGARGWTTDAATVSVVC